MLRLQQRKTQKAHYLSFTTSDCDLSEALASLKWCCASKMCQELHWWGLDITGKQTFSFSWVTRSQSKFLIVNSDWSCLISPESNLWMRTKVHIPAVSFSAFIPLSALLLYKWAANTHLGESWSLGSSVKQLVEELWENCGWAVQQLAEEQTP